MSHRTSTTSAPLLPFAFALGATLASCQQPSSRAGAGAEPPPPGGSAPSRISGRAAPRTVLLQVLGLPGAWVERWLRQGRFLPGSTPASARLVQSGGLARLAGGAYTTALRPVDPTVAAPNLATMLTGVSPQGHGILADHFLRDGRRVSGYAAPLATPPLWERARRRGRRVVTWLALGTRCGEPPPPGLRALCHPGRAGASAPRAAVEVPLRPAGHLDLRAPAGAPGQSRIALQVRWGGPQEVRLGLPAGAVLVGDASLRLRPGDSRAVLWGEVAAPSRAPAPRRLTWITLRELDGRRRRALFHEGGSSVTLASPPSFARRLEGLGLLRPAPDDLRHLRQGRITPRLYAETALRELEGLVRFAQWLGRGDRFDLAVITVTAVARLGRALLAPPAHPALTAVDVKAHRVTLERALRRWDQQLGRLLDGLDLARTRVVLASTPGGLPVTTDVSLRAALWPLHPRLRVLTAQGAAFVHLPEGVTPEAVLTRLRGLRAGGQDVFTGGRLLAGAELGPLGLPPHAAVIFAQARAGVVLSARRRRALTGWPTTLAAAGHRSDLPALQAVLLAAGPGLRHHGPLGPLAMRQVAALVAEAAGLPRPPTMAAAPGLWPRGDASPAQPAGPAPARSVSPWPVAAARRRRPPPGRIPGR